MEVVWRVLQRLRLRLGGQRQLLFFILIVVVAGAFLSSGRFKLVPPPPAPPESGTVAVAAAAGSPEAGVQQVILSGNRQQERAIAQRNSSPMRELSTDKYFAEVQRANQDMLDNGVASIKLVSLDWGDVAINGDSATATTWETWTVTFSDGTEAGSRDRNVYHLVRSNGVWRVESDEHPD
ncbi:MAG: hypothetical protein A3F84_29420 [Candidatus Handelsmanbacteria bacterium RIFCSPLOWO2_12_FULL_64_10]|uniref:DUF4440 domain-containing protein n=1 Tax=Handelsmanbacteria sp. (strain RIFCSPLOWO2_12_FULL_64_10) TaxID=1817868 RepID=A0A1F6CDI1_HANXR|nr:MAG: hypothetical protein A3F84_29420 [Candidatus Handelsmanbacteria bacterium RIFCSPLOWO2_12_FULL_64_10]